MLKRRRRKKMAGFESSVKRPMSDWCALLFLWLMVVLVLFFHAWRLVIPD